MQSFYTRLSHPTCIRLQNVFLWMPVIRSLLLLKPACTLIGLNHVQVQRRADELQRGLQQPLKAIGDGLGITADGLQKTFGLKRLQ